MENPIQAELIRRIEEESVKEEIVQFMSEVLSDAYGSEDIVSNWKQFCDNERKIKIEV